MERLRQGLSTTICRDSRCGCGRHAVADAGRFARRAPHSRSMGILPMSIMGVSPMLPKLCRLPPYSDRIPRYWRIGAAVFCPESTNVVGAAAIECAMDRTRQIMGQAKRPRRCRARPAWQSGCTRPVTTAAYPRNWKKEPAAPFPPAPVLRSTGIPRLREGKLCP
jgi:hypothetical protein